MSITLSGDFYFKDEEYIYLSLQFPGYFCICFPCILKIEDLTGTFIVVEIKSNSFGAGESER